MSRTAPEAIGRVREPVQEALHAAVHTACELREAVRAEDVLCHRSELDDAAVHITPLNGLTSDDSLENVRRDRAR